MQNNSIFILRRLGLTFSLALALLALTVTASTQAAPAPQTVPPPTEVPVNTPVPTVTPFQEDDEDDEDDEDGGGDSGGDNRDQQDDAAAPAAATPAAEATASEASTGEPTAAETVAFPGRISVGGLNVRLGPGTTFDVIGTLTRADEFDVLGRSEANTWWLICCLPETEMRGWVSARFVETDFSLEEALVQLPILPDDAAQTETTAPTVAIAESAAPTVTEATTEALAITPSLTAAAAQPASVALDFALTHEPLYPVQGEMVRFHYVITNTSAVEAEALMLRNELPETLSFDEELSTTSGELTRFTLDAGATVFAIEWPALAPGAAVTATVALALDGDLPDGSVVDNLAVALAENAEAQTAGVSLGLPPAAPPTFR